MAVTTVETWTADGLVLNTYAYNISTHTGRSGLPKIRGENRITPYRGGRTWVPKVWDERDLLLEMWVLGNDGDGNVPTLHSQRAEFNENLATLKKVFGKRHDLIQIVRQEDRPDGLLALTGGLEVIGTMEPTTSNHGTLGVMTVQCMMPDPFWYGTKVTETLTSAGLEIVNPGSTIAEKMILTFNGPLTNPAITNVDLGITLRYNGSIAGGQSVTVDTGEFTAISNTLDNRVGRLSNIGSYWWMNFKPDSNDLTLTNWQSGAVGAGNIGISYYPPYL